MRNLTDQLDRWMELGVPAAVGIAEPRLRELAAPVLAQAPARPANPIFAADRAQLAACLRERGAEALSGNGVFRPSEKACHFCPLAESMSGFAPAVPLR